MKHLIELLDNWKPRRVLVLGDFMLDELRYGEASRLSPDAPVPVLKIEKSEDAPGGASNVSMDLAALKCEVVCLGVVGDDSAGASLKAKLVGAGCEVTGLVVASDRPTTVKRSYIGLAQHRHPQKMFRVDYESNKPLEAETERVLMGALAAELGGADVLCIEDYNKGVLNGGLCGLAIDAAREAGVPVIVDPAAIEDYSRYKGATAITPNRTEAKLATELDTEREDQLELAARRLVDELELEAAVLTVDRHGALLLERGGEPRLIPTLARNVYDVSGAGDMVLAALAAGRANGADWVTAVELANAAAGLEVEKFGVVPIPLEELHLSLILRNRGELGKVRAVDDLVVELRAHRAAGRRVALTNGCFDILHAGHVELLGKARATADLLVVAVNTDLSISKLKGAQRPIVSEADRTALLAALEAVDYLVLFGDGEGGEADTPIPLLRALKPEVLVKGGDYKHDEVVGWEIVESYGGMVVTIPPVAGRSTTNIVEKIRGGG